MTETIRIPNPIESTGFSKGLIALAAILVIAVAFGGGGSRYGFANLIVQLGALLALSFHRQAFAEFWRAAPFMLRLLVAVSILVPLLQMVPLPESIWRGLPGRELVAQSYALLGESGSAPLSVFPIRTLLALTALITPLAVLAIGWGCAKRDLLNVGWICVALGILNLMIGVPQVLSTDQSALLYPENLMPGVLFGTFANRNSTALFLVGALALAALLPVPGRVRRMEVPARLILCALLVLAIVLTRSRTGLVLAIIPVGLFATRFILTQLAQRQGGQQDERRKGVFALAIAGVGILLIGSALALAPGRIADTIDRFEGSGDDARAYIWEDAAYSADRYWPVGSGIGTFDEVFQIDESLENLTTRRAGRAHNDYIEIAIEAGLPGIVLVAGWLLLLAWLSWKARSSEGRWIAWSGSAILFAIALQSLTDYPLRNQTMLAFGAFALVLLLRFGRSGQEPQT